MVWCGVEKLRVSEKTCSSGVIATNENVCHLPWS